MLFVLLFFFFAKEIDGERTERFEIFVFPCVYFVCVCCVSESVFANFIVILCYYNICIIC